MKKLSRLEWLSVIIIISVLLLITIPILFGRIERKYCPGFNPYGGSVVGSIGRVQKYYHFTHKRFLDTKQSLQELICIDEQACLKYWSLSIEAFKDIAFVYTTAREPSQNRYKLYSYVGAIYYDKAKESYYMISCRTIQPSTNTPPKPIFQKSKSFLFWKQEANWQCSPTTTDC